ncbi:MAG: hypothetical protein AB8G15_18310 [Saprospiraceae bacterium]
MKKNNANVFFLLLFCSFCFLQCKDEASDAPKSTNAEQPTVLTKPINQALQKALSFTEADQAAVLAASQQRWQALQLTDELAKAEALSLLQYQEKLTYSVQQFDRLGDQQLYKLREEQTLIRTSFTKFLNELAQDLTLPTKSAAQLNALDQQLDQQLEETVAASNTACNSIANPEICKRLLAVTQLYALQQMAVKYSLKKNPSAQEKVNSYLAQSTDNVFNYQYPEAVKKRLYQRQKDILATSDLTKQDELLRHYFKLKEILKAKKIGLSEEKLTAVFTRYHKTQGDK